MCVVAEHTSNAPRCCREMLALLVVAPTMLAFAPSCGPALQLARSAVTRIRCSEQDTYETNDLVVAARKGRIDALTELLGRDGTDVDLAVSCTKISSQSCAVAVMISCDIFGTPF